MIDKVEVSKPKECPFADKDYYGDLDGCQLAEKMSVEYRSSCYNPDCFPDRCPLKMGTIEIVLKSE